MDGILNDGQRGRLWMCKKNNGHALGIIIIDKHSIERLLLFREARSLDFVRTGITTVVFSTATKTKCIADGTIHDIECEICGAKRTWWMDKKITISLIAPMYDKSLTK